LSLAQIAYVQGLFVSADQAEPVYVRDEVSWKKLPGR
ncbi:TPA: tRNA (adenosine(37)-N6)-threonylcarbamoyltransferase complex dimerization subunit type 1 TsaB, partial [Candidatus Azambacteria bacterium]|nr:tRNA (adenosine(37)-N6)-threonylcarbamoyltransferase complex dimerization subunit type 1 TsaB [Candidatus Azambacteria bacterium]